MPHTPSPRTVLAAALLLAASPALTGCESDAQTGALIGAGLGAVAGQAIGGDSEATLIGAAVGGGAGYLVGNEADKKDPRRTGPEPIAPQVSPPEPQ